MPGKMHNVNYAVKPLYAWRAFASAEAVLHTVNMDISRFRRARNLSQADVAEAIGVSQSKLHRFEAGHKSAMLSTAHAYAEYFGVTLADLFNEDLSGREIDLLRAFRAVPEGKRDGMVQLFFQAQSLADATDATASPADAASDPGPQQ